MDPTPHRPEAANPLDELSPTLRPAVEAVRNQPIPLEAQDTLRRVEEEEPPMSNRIASPPAWSRPSVALAALAASVAIAFCAGYWLRPAQGTDNPEDVQLAQLKADLAASHATLAELQDHKAKVPLNFNSDRIGDVSVPGKVNPAETIGVSNAPVPANPSTPGIPLPPGVGGGTGTATSTSGPGGQGGFGLPGGPVPPTGPVAPGGGLPGYAPQPGFIPGPGGPPVATGPAPVPPFPTPAPLPQPGLPAPPVVLATPTPGTPPPVSEPARAKRELQELTRDQQKIVAETAQLWGKLPATERRSEVLEKALREKFKDMPPAQRAAVVAAVQLQGVPALGLPNVEGATGDTFNYYIDNPYLAVRNAQLSTFSTSVDTASYVTVRDLLKRGQLPTKDAVRIADMLNYFPYEYPAPKGADPVAFAMNMTTCPWNANHQLLRVAVAAKQYTPNDMPPRNFVFLLDTSGSMRGELRLTLLVQGLKMLVEQLRAQDRVAIVTYAGHSSIALPSTPGNEKPKILAALDSLTAGGSTNGVDGVNTAYKLAADNFIQGGVNRVILGTDGDWNVGTTDPAELCRLAEEKRKTGVFLTVLGYGYGNRKDSTLEKIAHHGAGHFAYVDSVAESKKIFVEQGAGLTTVAKDVKLQLEFNPQRVAGYRLIGYENKLLRDQDFNDDTVHAGNMGSGHHGTVLYEIVPAGVKVPNVPVDDLKYQLPPLPADAANTGEFLTVKMRYKDPEAETSKKLEQPLAGAVEKFETAHSDLRWAAAVAEFGMLLRDSPYKGTATYAHALATAERALGGEDTHRVEFLALVKKAKELAKEGVPEVLKEEPQEVKE